MYIAVENKNHIELLAGLAREIWTNHFGPMLGTEILKKIIEKVQSQEAIANQIEEGYLYNIILSEDAPVGYFAYRMGMSKNELFLSKLYLISSERRKGHGKQVIHHLEEICRTHNTPIIRLTVYQENTSAIAVYEKNGFKIIGSIIRDLGGGIIINDYEMEKHV